MYCTSDILIKSSLEITIKVLQIYKLLHLYVILYQILKIKLKGEIRENIRDTSELQINK